MTALCKIMCGRRRKGENRNALRIAQMSKLIENTGLQVSAEDGERLYFCLCSASDLRLLCI